MRAIWNGVVSFGLVTVPVRLYPATATHDFQFHQVHRSDGGRIRYKRFCEVCGVQVRYEDIVKGYETDDGELVTLDEQDMAGLPNAVTRQIVVLEFVPTGQVDPLLLDRGYYLEPDPKVVRPYALLRRVLGESGRTAVTRVALRQRETLALLRVRGNALVLQTMLWPDEVREPDFPLLDEEVELPPQELRMAADVVDALAADFDPTRYKDQYTRAMGELIAHKKQCGGARPAPATTPGGAIVPDLLTALKRSVEEVTGHPERHR